MVRDHGRCVVCGCLEDFLADFCDTPACWRTPHARDCVSNQIIRSLGGEVVANGNSTALSFASKLCAFAPLISDYFPKTVKRAHSH